MRVLVLFLLIGIVSFGLFGFSQNVDAVSTDYLYEFGTSGIDNGQLSAPVQASLNSDNLVYVVENGNHRVSVFDSDGVFQFNFGSFGSANGAFKYPVGIAVGPSDDVYVVDKNNYRVQVFDPAGNYLRQFGSFGSANDNLNLPHGIAVDEFENIYIADYNNYRVQKFDSTGNLLLTFGSGPGNQPGLFKLPTTIALSSNGNVYVTDTFNHRVQVFDSAGNYLTAFGGYGPGLPGKFGYESRGIGIDSDDNVFVGDLRGHRYHVFDSEEIFIKSFGTLGAGDGQFSFPVASPGFDGAGHIFIADTGNDRVQVFGTLMPADIIAPVVSISSETVEATSSDGASVSFTTSATDDTDGSLTTICDYTSGDMFPLGTTTVTCTATDVASNEGTGSGTFTVQDTIAPVITAPDNITLEATALNTSVTIIDVTTTDAVGPITITNDNSLTEFPVGVTTIIWTATDGNDNSATATQTITIQDTTSPIVTTEDISTVATSFDGATVTYLEATATDVVGISDGPTCDVTSGSTLPIGTTTVTCTAEDGAGNIGTSSFNITVNAVPLQTQKTFTIEILESLETTEKKTDKEIEKAIKSITKSQDDKNWETGDTLTKHGKKVFDGEKKAVKELLKVIKKDKEIESVIYAISGVIDELVRIDSELANNALAEAQLTMGDKSEKEIAKAEKELLKAADELAKGKPDKAIDKFKKVWEHSQHAMKHDENN